MRKRRRGRRKRKEELTIENPVADIVTRKVLAAVVAVVTEMRTGAAVVTNPPGTRITAVVAAVATARTVTRTKREIVTETGTEARRKIPKSGRRTKTEKERRTKTGREIRTRIRAARIKTVPPLLVDVIVTAVVSADMTGTEMIKIASVAVIALPPKTRRLPCQNLKLSNLQSPNAETVAIVIERIEMIAVIAMIAMMLVIDQSVAGNATVTPPRELVSVNDVRMQRRNWPA